MMTVSTLSRKTTRKTGTEKTSTAMVALIAIGINALEEECNQWLEGGERDR
jgi:hypothetical protein